MIKESYYYYYYYYGSLPVTDCLLWGRCRSWTRGEEASEREPQGATADAQHQLGVLGATRLHPERSERHEAVQDQDAAPRHQLHRLPDGRAQQGRPARAETAARGWLQGGHQQEDGQSRRTPTQGDRGMQAIAGHFLTVYW